MAKDARDGEGESFEETVFKTISHQKRRDILRFVGERKEATFTEIKNAIQTEDSPSLSYHLNALSPLIIQKEGKYKLSEMGRDTYNLMCKIAAYSVTSSIVQSIRKTLPAAIIANAVLWVCAIFSVSLFEGRLHQMTILSFAVIWLISNSILYSLSKRVKE